MNDLHFTKSELDIILMALCKFKNELCLSKLDFIKDSLWMSTRMGEDYVQEWNKKVKEYNIQIYKIEELENKLQEVLE